MSRNIKSLFILSVLFAKSISACDFPCFNNLKKIPQNENLIQIHINLSKKVQNPPQNPDGTSRNLFECCFRFRFNDNTSTTIYIDTIFESCDPFWDEKQYPCSATIKNLIFKCVTKIPNNENIKYLTYLYGGKESPQPISREPLILSLKKTYENRNKKQVQNPIKKKTSARAVRITDGETQSIHTISNEDFLQKNLIDKLPKGKKIVKIEFHGCTTFDMCPFCFANMNMVQFLANHNIDAGFLGLLKSLLGNQKLLATPDDIPTTIIISSCRNGRYFHNEQYGWKSDNIMTKKVNQFRIIESKDSLESKQLEKQYAPPKEEKFNTEIKTKKKKTKKEKHKQQQPIQKQLTTLGYEIHDVLGDGNCGIYAILRNLGLENNQNIALCNAIFPENHRMRQDREWLGMEDLNHVATYLNENYNRGLIIVNTVPRNIALNDVILPDDYVYTYYANGQWYNANSLDEAVHNVNEKTGHNTKPVILLYTPDHWKAVLKI